jgi:hypothetical protein
MTERLQVCAQSRRPMGMGLAQQDIGGVPQILRRAEIDRVALHQCGKLFVIYNLSPVSHRRPPSRGMSVETCVVGATCPPVHGEYSSLREALLR